MNGVTGYIDGYEGPRCFPTLAPVLAAAGFDTAEVHGILAAMRCVC